MIFTPPAYMIPSNAYFRVLFFVMRDFRKGIHHYILILHHHIHWCILLHIHLAFPHNGCHIYLYHHYAHHHLWKLYWCLKFVFLLSICNLTFFSTSFHRVPFLLFFYHFMCLCLFSFSNFDLFPWFCNRHPCDQTCDNNDNIHRTFLCI